MFLHEKLQRYFDENGIQRKWFASKLSVTPQYFYQVINGHQKLPSSLWQKVIELTNGQITLADILEDEFKNIEYLKVIKGETPDKCEVIIKNFTNR